MTGRYVLALLLLLAGCAAPKAPSVIVFNENLADSANQWRWEAINKYHRPVCVVACHGFTFLNQWWCHPDEGQPMHVETMARVLHAAYPSQLFMLDVCNGGAHDIDVPNVLYAHKGIWATPRRFRFKNLNESSAVGRIEEFATTQATQP